MVNGLTCSQNGKAKAEELFGDSIIWVDVCKPGYILSKICFDLMEEYKKEKGKAADIILLENLGFLSYYVFGVIKFYYQEVYNGYYKDK